MRSSFMLNFAREIFKFKKKKRTIKSYSVCSNVRCYIVGQTLSTLVILLSIDRFIIFYFHNNISLMKENNCTARKIFNFFATTVKCDEKIFFCVKFMNLSHLLKKTVLNAKCLISSFFFLLLFNV